MKHWYLFFPFIIFHFSCSHQKVKEDAYLPPNILFAIADDVSFPHMGAYGCDWVKTPHFDRVAREGLLFQNAFTPNAKCAPSRAIILTGRNSWQLEEAANHFPFFPKKFKTFFEALKENGYHTGHTAKGFAPGDPGMINGKKRELVGKAYSQIKTEPPTTEIGKIDYTANFEAFLKERKDHTPFCFWYGSFEPHRAYEYGTGQRLGGKKPEDIDHLFDFFPDLDTVRNDILDYAYELEYYDQHLGKMLALLEASGELDNTIIIATADNGMPFPRAKGQVYERSNHLPLAIMWGKGIKNPGRVIEEFVSFTDFAPTVIDLAGISQDSAWMQAFEGNSLRSLFEDTRPSPRREYMLVGKERHDVGRPNDWGYPVRGIRTDQYLYLINFKPDRWPSGNPETGYLNTDGSPTKTAILHLRRFGNDDRYWKWSFGKRPGAELYDLRRDPDCINNLAADPDYGPVLIQLNNQLMEDLKQQQDPRIFGQGDVFDNYVYSNEKHRNFYNRYTAGKAPQSNIGWVNADDFEILK